MKYIRDKKREESKRRVVHIFNTSTNKTLCNHFIKTPIFSDDIPTYNQFDLCRSCYHIKDNVKIKHPPKKKCVSGEVYGITVGKYYVESDDDSIPFDL